MSFKVIEHGTNRKLVYELLLVVYSNFRRITHRFRYRLQAVLMLKTTYLLTPLVHVFDLEFESHAVGMLETKFGDRKLESCGCHIW